MTLYWLPGPGAPPWAEGRWYTIQDQVWIRDAVVVLGRLTLHAHEGDWFVAVYDHDGQRFPGSGARTMPLLERAREVFDAYVRGRREAA